MELRGQEKELGMPSSFKLISSFAPINPPRTLDHHTELNPERRIDDPGRDSDQDPDPDPVSAPVPTLQPTTVAGPSPTSRDISITISSSSSPLIRYRECLKNHAAGMGGHVVDGCGEFMPSGEDGTQEALKCAACECHRNFHRKEINGESQYPTATCFTYHKNNTRRDGTVVHPQPQQQQPMPLRQQRVAINGSSNGTRLPIAPLPPVMMNFGNGGGGPADSSSEDRNMFDWINARGTGRSSYPQSSKKRFRTKFSGDQKDKMMEFAEKLGWRIQKQDEQELQQFCCEVGIKRQVFKVWMHNSKQAMKRKKM